MEEMVRTLLAELGDDPDREGLAKTPARFLSAFKDMTSGFGVDAGEVLESAVFPADSKGMVVCRDVSFVSVCEHHLLPFVGDAVIAFLPGEHLVGISKLVRVTEIFARRLQVQERLGQQILDAINEVLEPAGCMVYLEALHLCMVARGVKQEKAAMATMHVSGEFERRPELAWAVAGRKMEQ